MASVYEEIGGAAAVEAAVDSFNVRVLADPAVAPYFENLDVDQLKGHQRAFLAAAVGDGRWQAGRMDAAHAALAISETEFDTLVAHMAATLAEHGFPTDIVAAVRETLEPLRARTVTAGSVDIRPGTVSDLPVARTGPAAARQRIS